MNREQLKNILDCYTCTDFENLYNKYSNWLVKEKVEPNVMFPLTKGSLLVIAVRCNETISFNNDIRNNDFVLLMQLADHDRGIKTYFFDCTTDPCGRKDKIAHLCEQIYNGNIGFHHADPARICIRSDFGFGTWVNRTDGNGDVIDLNTDGRFTSEPGHFGINIHNNNGFYNSSLGCIILSNETEYKTAFKPVLEDCRDLPLTNQKHIPVMVINAADFEDILATSV